MAKKGDTDLDKLNLDDFDFEIPQFDVTPPKDNRKPATRLAAAVYKGAKAHVVTPAAIEKVLRLSLPKGYSQAFNAKDAIIKSGKELYNTAGQELRPAAPAIRKAAEKLSAVLPASVLKTLKEFGLDKNGYAAGSATQQRRKADQDEMSAALSELFEGQRAQAMALDAKNTGNEMMRAKIEDDQHKGLIEQTQIVAQGVSRLVGYQDGILNSWQKKMLELQYRQFFVNKELLDITSVQNGKVLSALESVIKNTGLPDLVKLHKTEIAGQAIRQRLMNSAMDGIGNYAKGYRERITGNAKGFLQGALAPLGMMGSQMSGGGMGGDPHAAAGYGLGKEASDAITSWMAMRARRQTSGNDFIRRGGAKLSSALTGIPQRIDDFAKSETTQTGYKGIASQFAKNLLPRYYLNDRVQGGLVENSDKAKAFDERSWRSLNEVIPGYLQRIAHWSKASATGDLSSPMEVYSLARGGFTSKENMIKDAKRVILPRSESLAIKREIEDYIDGIDRGGELDEKAKRGLTAQILGDVSKGKSFDLNRLTNANAYDKGVDKESAKKIAKFFKEKFKVGADGESTDTSTENVVRMANAKKYYDDLQNVLPGSGERVRALADALGRDTLREMGLITRVNGQDKVDYDSLWKMQLDVEQKEGDAPIITQAHKRDLNRRDAGVDERLQEALAAAQRRRQEEQQGYRNNDRDESDNDATVGAGGYNPNAKPRGEPAGGGINASSLQDMLRRALIDGQQQSAKVGPSVNDESLEKYLGADSPILKELQLVRTAIVDNHSLEWHNLEVDWLMEINKSINSMAGIPRGEGGDVAPGGGSGGGPSPAGKKGLGKRILMGAIKAPFKALGWYAKKTAQFYKGVAKYGTKGLIGGVKLGFRGITGTGTTLFKGRGTTDIYVKGQELPAIRKVGMEAGEYIDVNSNKVIKSIDDITGPVKDKDGNFAITQADFEKGLVNPKGKSIARRGAGLLGKAAMGYMKLATSPYRALWAVTKWTAKGVFGLATKLKDGYIRGRTEPAIIARLLSQGEYFDKETGDPITSYKDIKGTVVDRDGQTVVTADELRRSGGLYDNKGSRIKAGLGALIGAAWKVATLPYRLAWKAAKGVFKGIRGLGRMMFGKKKKGGAGGGIGGADGDDLVQLNYHQLTVQEQILNFLVKRFDKKKVLGDTNGDGVRDGSWRDMLNRRKTSKEEADKKAGGKDPAKGMLGGLGGMLAGLFKRKKKDEGDEDDGGGSGPDIGDIDIDRDGKKGRGRGRGGRGGRGGGKMAKLGRGLKTAGKFLGRNAWKATRFIGRQVLWRGLQWGATALAGLVSAPVLIGAAVVAGVAIGGYLIYKHYADRPPALRALRMKQYGFKPTEGEIVGKIVKLEEMLTPAVRYGEPGTIPTLADSQVNVGEMLSIFGIDTAHPEKYEAQMRNWANWFAGRFKPTFLTYLGKINDLTKGTKLQELDDKLPAPVGVAYVNGVRLGDNAKNFDVMIGPFADEELTQNNSDVEDAWKTALEFYKKKALENPAPKETVLTGAEGAAATAAAVAAAKGTGGVAPKKEDAQQNTAMASYAGRSSGAAALMARNKMEKGKALGPAVDPSRTALDTAYTVRYKVYGLTEMDVDKVRALMALEAFLWDGVKYDGEKVAFTSDDSEKIYPQVSASFGLAPAGDDTQKGTWFSWYRFRFLPTFLQFCSAVRARAMIDAKEAGSKLTPTQLGEVLEHTSAATVEFQGTEESVWNVELSPWFGYKLNTDPNSVTANIEALKAQGKVEKTYKEPAIPMQDKVNSLLTPQNNLPIGPGNSMSNVDNKTAPSPLAGYKDGSLTQRSSVLQKNSNVFSSKGSGAGSGGVPLMAGGGSMSAGMAMEQPGGGSGGDINQVPNSTGDGWNSNKATIMAAAKMAGFDPAIAATTAAIESGFRPTVKAPTSSATGLFQFISDTWKEQIRKYGSKYGINPNTPPTDARANALMGMEFMKDNVKALSGLGRKITDTDVYLAHFLGPGGAKRFLTAPPNDPATKHVKDNVPGANASIFFNNGRPRTVSEVYNLMSSKLEKGRRMHDLKAGATNDAQLLPPGAAGAEAANEASFTPEAGGGATNLGATASGFGPQDKSMSDPTITGSSSGAPAMGSRGAEAVASGGGGVASGSQASAAAGLSSPTPSEQGAATDPALAAAVAQKQASRETGSVATSMDAVTTVLQQTLVHTAQLDSNVQSILEMMKTNAGQSAAPSGTAQTKSPPPSTQKPKEQQKLPQAPIGIMRMGSGT